MTEPKENNAPLPLMTGQRRAQITALVRERGSVRVEELSARFGISAVTIRGDLAALERDGQLQRDRGGAVVMEQSLPLTSLLAVEQRAHLRIEDKQRIGRVAAALVAAGDTIFMDAGTTVVEMTQHLADIPQLTIVTNALNVALQCGQLTSARIILLGGEFNREASSTLGSMAEQMLGELLVQKLFLGTQALNAAYGLTDTTPEIAQAKRAMIRSARRVILLSDSSKWDRVGFVKVVPLTAVHTLITDEKFPADAREVLQEAGVELMIC